MITTRAAVVESANAPFAVTTVDLDEPQAHEVLVRMVATGLCHTDLGARMGGVPFPLPGVLGHEGAGIIEQVGSDVSGFEIGDHVILSFTSCGECASCLGEHPAYCETWLTRNIFSGTRSTGASPISRDGQPIGGHFFGQSSFAELAIVDERSLVKVDPDADLSVLAPLGCGVQTGYGSIVNVLRPRAGSSLAVFGSGAVGLSGVMAAARLGLTTLVAVDVVPARLEIARELGATHVIDASIEDVAARLAEITGPGGLDYAFDTTGNPSVARQAIDALGIGGTLAVCGAPPPGTEIPVDIQGILPGKTITGITMGDSNPAVLIPELIRLHAAGELPLERLIHTYSLDTLEQAAEDMHHGTTIKPVIVF